MSQSQDYVALEWVRKEIASTLKDARNALEQFMASPDDPNQLPFCLSWLHQVYGTLHMVEFHGAAMLAQEMENLTRAMVEERIPASETNLALLLQAILQLPHYLEELQAGQLDSPVILLPLINELLTAQGKPGLSESNLFSPDLTPALKRYPKLPAQIFTGQAFMTLVDKLRKLYQIALLGLLRDQQIDENLDYATRVLQRLQSFTKRTALGPYLELQQALVHALRQEYLPLGSGTKKLLRQLDEQLKQMGLAPLELLAEPASEESLRALLYYLAQVQQADPLIDELKARYGIHHSLLTEQQLADSRQRLQGPDQDAIDTVSLAIRQELDELMAEVDSQKSLPEASRDPEAIVVRLRPLADTLTILGQGALGQKLKVWLTELVPTGLDEASLMQGAALLLEVESCLGQLGQRQMQTQDQLLVVGAQRAVVVELVQQMENCKERLAHFLANPNDRSLLQDLPAQLVYSAKTLHLSALSQSAFLVESLAAYLQEQVLPAAELPEAEALNHLADVVMTLEYYFERFHRDGHLNQQPLLDRVGEHLLALGQAPKAADSAAEPAESQAPAAESEMEPQVSDPALESSAEPEIEAEPAAAAIDDLIDPDILEVFLEEVTEVEQSLHAWLPLLMASQQPEPQGLADVRRAYHTLKGSGRMVGAMDLGETAWAIESMFNSILEGSLPLSQDHLRLAKGLLMLLPELIDAFTRGQLPDALAEQISDLQRIAHAQAQGNAEPLSPWLLALLATSETEPESAADIAPLVMDSEPELEASEFWPEPTATDLEANSAEYDLSADAQVGVEGQWLVEGEYSLTDDETETEATLEYLPAGDLSSLTDLDLESELESVADAGTELDNEAASGPEDLNNLDDLDLPILGEDAQLSELDPDLIEMFEQELNLHLAVLLGNFEQARRDGHCQWQDEIQRALHTIKGSASMAGVTNIAALSAQAEQLVKQLRERHIDPDWDLFGVLEDTCSAIVALNDARAEQGLVEPDPSLLERLDMMMEERLSRHHDESGSVSGLGLMSLFESDSLEEILAADFELDRWCQQQEWASIEQLGQNLITLSDVAFAIDLIPIYTHCVALGDACLAIVRSEHALDAEQRASLTLGLASLLNQFDRLAADQSIRPQIEAEVSLRQLTASLTEPEPEISLAEGLPLAELAISDEDLTTPVDEQEDGFELEPEDEPDTEAEEAELEVEPDLDDDFEAEPRLQDLEEPEEVAEPSAELEDETESSQEQEPQLEQVGPTFEAAPEPSLPPEPNAAMAELVSSLLPDEAAAHASRGDNWWALTDADETLEIFFEEAEDLLNSIADALQAWKNDPANPQPLLQLQRDLHTFKGAARMAQVTPVGDLSHELEFLYEYLAKHPGSSSMAVFSLAQQCQDELSDMVHEVQAQGGCPLPQASIARLLQARTQLQAGKPLNLDSLATAAEGAAPVPEAGNALSLPPHWMVEVEQSDQDLLAIFLEEAQDLCTELLASAKRWQANPKSLDASDDIKRQLHTLKGGAGVANLALLGQYCHNLESAVVQASLQVAGTDFYQEFVVAVGQLSDQVTDLLHQQLSAEQVADDASPATQAAVYNAKANPSVPKPDAARQSAKASPPQESVRVPANLLETLVNLAGETSISRSRLEQQVNDFGFTLSDIEMTINRLREQVRRLDRETEAQVQFRQEKAMEAEQSGGEGFDPLEFDRYSTIQQLSRALVESTSDLMDLKNTLTDKTRDAETLLLQQSRVNTELQEGLMQTRMVPFARLLPRLRRLVRQVADELGKEVELLVDNAEGELDRSVLERLQAPLEHMLRNAIAHGIESAPERRQAKKSNTGYVGIAITREGGDVVVRLSDDGRGLNSEKIRAKAIEQGLIQATDELSDEQIQQLIMAPGFSTAEQVTQISGRGVGMDVVANEVRDLGGSLDIQSREGQGTTFIMRIPFTVSVNRTLMVTLGDEYYALPLNTVEAIVRVPFATLMQHLQSGQPYYYQDQPFQVEYLGRLLESEHSLPLQDGNPVVPLLLIKGQRAGMGLGIHIDQLLGAREIVVKSIGPGFASVPGLSGATILGDGRVVVILDMPNMWRSDILQLENNARAALVQEQKAALIMVVDDSVTVRKVTSRLLERYGYRVLLAKDGVDALVQLQDHVPDVFLLDIEMPRMDGFELASRIRHQEGISDKPIVMITSRTGSKHRERARSIGVNEYLGKPFQEPILMAVIERLLADEATTQAP